MLFDPWMCDWILTACPSSEKQIETKVTVLTAN